jgi:hypothetical protein
VTLPFLIKNANCEEQVNEILPIEREYFQVEVNNPAFRPNILFRSSEDLTSPKFQHLIDKYQLDMVVLGETDEFKRFLLLRHWIKTTIKIDDYGYPLSWRKKVENILDETLKGQGYHCGHFMKVQNAVMN